MPYANIGLETSAPVDPHYEHRSRTPSVRR